MIYVWKPARIDSPSTSTSALDGVSPYENLTGREHVELAVECESADDDPDSDANTTRSELVTAERLVYRAVNL